MRITTLLIILCFTVRVKANVYVVTNTNDAFGGSLRDAIAQANANPGKDTIAFNIGGGGFQSIKLLSAFDYIIEPVVIDGTTQPGYNSVTFEPIIEINGINLGGSGTGFYINNANNVVVKGFIINGFSNYGVYIYSDSCKVENCYIGTDSIAASARPNGTGIIINGRSNNIIGGILQQQRNIISGNSQSGILIYGDNNEVIGNFIGTDKTGTIAIPNYTGGIQISSGKGNHIGNPLSGNLISGHFALSSAYGIALSSATDNLIQNNYIGTTISSADSLPNDVGIALYSGASRNVIGGANSGEGNVISGNNNGIYMIGGGDSTIIQGNFIGTNFDGSIANGNDNAGMIISGNYSIIGGAQTGEGNVISANANGVILQNTNFVSIKGNYIGTDATGLIAMGNTYDGISCSSSNHALIGGATNGDRNIVSGNHNTGINLNGDTNIVQGNYIGIAADGLTAIPNGFGLMSTGSGTKIGGTSPSEGNIVSGNTNIGIYLVAAKHHFVLGNLVGTDETGNAALPNGTQGISIVSNSKHTLIGTDGVAYARNVIAGSNQGIYVDGADSCIIQGNFIGVGLDGSTPLGNGSGIHINSSYTTVGGSLPAQRNVISGNISKGVYIAFNAQNNKITGNFIGTNASCTAGVPNQTGVFISGSSCFNNVVGGSQNGESNVISGNTSYGVQFAGGTRNNFVIGNKIGTDSTGTAAIPNSSGIVVTAPHNYIGGAQPGEGNLLSGNNQDGIFFNGGGDSTIVAGNLIGTDITGTVALPNGVEGIRSDYGNCNIIGGTSAGERNIISGNDGDGINLFDYSLYNKVIGNYIGVDISGNNALPNKYNGIHLWMNARNTFVGGDGNGNFGNVIAGNDSCGILISESDSVYIAGNVIGLNASLLPLGNGADGIRVTNTSATAQAIKIGDYSNLRRNRIAFNKNGVSLTGNDVRAAIVNNDIYGNTQLSIDNGANGISLNDVDDVDGGANDLQNFPVISCVDTANGSVQFNYVLDGKPNTDYYVEFYFNATRDASQYGQANNELNNLNQFITTDANGDYTGIVTGAPIGSGSLYFTAIATDTAAFTTSEVGPSVKFINLSHDITNATCSGNNGSVTVHSYGALEPYTFNWTPAVANDSVLTSLGAGTYTVIIQTANNCILHDTIAITATISPVIQGQVSYDSSGTILPILNGTVTLFEVDSNHTILSSVTQSLVGGTYTFDSLSATGNYILFSEPDRAQYFPNIVPQYHNNIAVWDSILVLNANCDDTLIQNIQHNYLPSDLGGSGTISGYVVVPFGGSRRPGEPVIGVDVSIDQVPGGMQAMRTTDTSGYYEFNNVADGTYVLYVNIPGKDMDSTYTVTINSATGDVIDTNKVFFVDSVSIYISDSILIVTGNKILDKTISEYNSLKVYPNPVLSDAILQIESSKPVKAELTSGTGSLLNVTENIKPQMGICYYTIDREKLNLKAGVYYLRLTSEEGTKAVKVIIR